MPLSFPELGRLPDIVLTIRKVKTEIFPCPCHRCHLNFNNQAHIHILSRDGNPVPRTVQMTFLQLIRLVHNEFSLI